VEFNPLITVITPVLNARKYIEECIGSVLNQSYRRIEHIFVDGGSTDGTLEILVKYSSNYPGRVRFITGRDKSPEDAWNKGICGAQGQILGWLGADDVYYPDAVEAVVEFFRGAPAAAFVFGGCDVVDENNRIIERVGQKDFDLGEALNANCVVAAASAFFTRGVVEKIGLLDTSFTPSDFDYCLRVAKSFRLYRVEKVLSRFRKHPGSIGGSKGAAARYAYIGYKTSRKHGGRMVSRRFLWYLMAPVSDFCRPVLGPIYPSIKKLVGWPWW
jgi:glycosyltransferase involved in cell wall biosynthesis